MSKKPSKRSEEGAQPITTPIIVEKAEPEAQSLSKALKDKKLRATYEGKFTIGEMDLSCAVLEDGSRIITYSAVFEAFGRTKRGAQKDDSRVHTMPAFLNARNLQAFVDYQLRELLVPIDYLDMGGNEKRGYNAMILPKLCKVYLDARSTLDPDTRKPILTRQQEPLARASEILLLGLSNIGIIALIDEATGYQYERERDELQKILQLYVAEELRPWAKTFPDGFYQEIFRLNGWDFTVGEIKKRPPIIGKWTNELIYNQLPKGVLAELKEKTPKSAAGNYVARFFQSLTSDIGVPGLHAQINSIWALMQVSDTWAEFIARFNKLVQRRAGQLELVLTKELPKAKPVVIQEPKFDDQLKALLSVPPPRKENKTLFEDEEPSPKPKKHKKK
ncbi:P63C domain-containing protein [Hymenobacter lucidus]|uniref:P63C domain-containing protein n=1 Tax=Hymenobacter lucidus TaxID=2880930 RepID=A0ABS8AT66_9BACT|nr:P63C domain-containing protein [Hymenobacter lucidus]MCB2409407.1 P63C domain-containing protein [Hymenobacter lucidus]